MDVVKCLKLCATCSAGLFAGGGLYINLVEHNTRSSLSVSAARIQWASGFRVAGKVYVSIVIYTN